MFERIHSRPRWTKLGNSAKLGGAQLAQALLRCAAYNVQRLLRFGGTA